RLVEEEDEVTLLVNALDLERRLLFGRVEELAVREVVDRVDRLLDAVFLEHEVVLVEAEDLMAAGVGDDGVDQHGVDLDLLTEWRLLLRGQRQRQESEEDCRAFHVMRNAKA